VSDELRGAIVRLAHADLGLQALRSSPATRRRRSRRRNADETGFGWNRERPIPLLGGE
jgi:hypothetical protein